MPKLAFSLMPPYKYSSWETFEADLAELASQGYNGVEISVGDPARLDVDRLGQTLASSGLELAGILTGDSYDEEGICLTVADVNARVRAIERLKAHVDWMAPFGGTIVIGRMQGMTQDEPSRYLANLRLVDCLREVAARAELHHIQLVFEPVERYEVNHNHTSAEALEIVEAVNSPALNIILDTFHINIEESSLDGPVFLVNKRLGYVHVADNHRGLVGTGHLDLARILRASLATGFRGYWTVVDFSPYSVHVRAASAMEYYRRSGLLDTMGPMR